MSIILYKRYTNKMYALERLRKFFTFEKVKVVATFLIERRFTYYPLIWADVQWVVKVQYKALNFVYNNYMLDKKVKIHQRSLQLLAIEIYKSRNKLDPTLCGEKYPVFTEKKVLTPLFPSSFQTQTRRNMG